MAAPAQTLHHEHERHSGAENCAPPGYSLHVRAINAIPAHCLILDLAVPGAPIIFANPAAAQGFRCGAQALIGRPFVDLTTQAEGLRRELRRIARKLILGQEARTEAEFRRDDGSTFVLGMTIAPLQDDLGRITHAVAFGRDITPLLEERRKKIELEIKLDAERRERERIALELRLAQRLESVGRLAAGIAHEINTPIQYVGDSVQFLRSAVEDLQRLNSVYFESVNSLGDSRQYDDFRKRIARAEEEIGKDFILAELPQAFDRTLEGIERVTHIVRAMKEFAHPASQEQVAADLNHAIETTLLVARNEYKYVARVELQLGSLPQVICNIGELNQVFLNLIVNSAHAVHESGRDLSSGLISIRTSHNEDFVDVEIEDNGCGIPPENLDRIFDPFFTTKEIGKGTGQGLAIAHNIVVDKHAGQFLVQSEPGKGTRMTIRIPVNGRDH